jgi:hypothetical protein
MNMLLVHDHWNSAKGEAKQGLPEFARAFVAVR